jgi:hypothetical protein
MIEPADAKINNIIETISRSTRFCALEIGDAR